MGSSLGDTHPNVGTQGGDIFGAVASYLSHGRSGLLGLMLRMNGGASSRFSSSVKGEETGVCPALG